MVLGGGPEPAPALDTGDVFMGYRIERIAGSGAMGIVYEAVQLSLDRRVALKVIAPKFSRDASYRSRFQREAHLAAAFDHPGVLPVIDHGADPDGVLWLSMRLVRGHTLEDRLRGGRPLSVADTMTLLGPVGDALDAAHDAGLVHRDVKPGNILIEGNDRGPRVYLSDFGLAKRVQVDGSDPTLEGQVLGTPRYMAPEQAMAGGHVDGVSDVYAFGCVLYRCLTGRVPFDGRDVSDVLQAHVRRPAPRPSAHVPELPPVFDVIVGQALAKNPTERPSSAGALMRRAATELERARTARARRPAPSPRPAPQPVPAPEPSRGIGWPAVAVILVLVAAAAAGGVALLAGSSRDGSSPSGVATLEQTTAAVRASSLTGRALQRLSASPTAAAMGTVTTELDRIVSESDRLRRAAGGARVDGQSKQLLGEALDGNAETARALRSVAVAPTSTSGSEIGLARATFRRSLDRLESLTRRARSALADSGSLSNANRDALGSVATDLATARDRSTRQFDALDRRVSDLEGSQ